MNTKKYLSLFAVLGTITSLGVALPTLADTSTQGQKPPQGQREQGRNDQFGKGQMRQGVFGTVDSISSNTITLTSKRGFGSTTPTSTIYTVDASNATVMKGNATSSLSNIAVGDNLSVQGTITGTNVVATKIFDGIAGGKENPEQTGKKEGQTTSSILGNGEPVVAGTISAIDGNTVTVTNKSNIAYTVDATNSKVMKGNATSSVASLVVGDSILVQGSVNGNSITSSTIIDQTNTTSNSTNNKQGSTGFFGGIGQFFMHLFGF
ncbi:MAG: DUF5666 domain-containing protein [bacterium]